MSSSPYNWSFPDRSETMFLATIQPSQSSGRRQPSSFQQHDIPGSQCKQQIPSQVTHANFSNSSFIEPTPQSHIMKNKYLGNTNLRTDDIEYAQPLCSNFKTARVVNPIMPRYQLPYVAPAEPEPTRKFLRNTLDVTDIKTKAKNTLPSYHQKQEIAGSGPVKLFRTVEAVNRLEVKDINKDGIFVSKRTQNPSNPLDPSYSWRDTGNHVNQTYGDIGNRSKIQIAETVNKRSDLAMCTSDIQGAKANSCNDRRHFMSQRRAIKDTLNSSDIAKTGASSLQKGITTSRHVNPLMPNYELPSVRY